MPRAAATLLLLTLTPAGVCIAQTPLLVVSQPTSYCPVGIQAQPTPGLTQMVVHGTPPGDRSPQTTPTPQQSLRFLLTNPKALGITGIVVTAHGMRPGGSLEPATSSTSGPDRIDQRVTLHLAVNPGKSATRDVRFDGFTSIRGIDLESVTYADGSMWHASEQQPCRFEPSRVMLVAGN
jgi:hypothetical protein